MRRKVTQSLLENSENGAITDVNNYIDVKNF